ncbi:sorting nexin-13-like [Liolophura sinensis]|uniref:sorting nexin-13-like n=1 Tax=Liolophura sinensis TaxID=3198878 RepID=UPI0031593A59
MTMESWHWAALGVLLFLTTFGFLGATYVILTLAGGCTIAYHYGKQKSLQILATRYTRLEGPHPGIDKISEKLEKSTKSKNFDRRMTGAATMDAILQEVLEYAIRDYIKTWYRQVSEHDGFLVEIQQCVQQVVIMFAHRTKSIDWLPYFTNRMVDDFASHIRLYRRALDLSRISKDEEKDEESFFFDLELEMENSVCRDLISTSAEDERQYLQDLSEVLLFLLLPQSDFQNKPFRYIVREVLVNGIFIPTIDLASDPDYINQTIAWWCKETSFSNETFMSVLKTTENIEELTAVKEKVQRDIFKWRSKDSGGDDDTVIKQNLSSLLFVKDVCEKRTKRLQEGPDDADNDDPEFCRVMSAGSHLFIMSLDDVINNNIALQYFIEFLSSRGGQQYLFFYLNVEGYRTAAEQQIVIAQEEKKKDAQALKPDLESLRRLASIIYDQYLSDKATERIRVDDPAVRRTHQQIKNKMLSEDVFDEVQSRVYQILHGEKYYEAFLQSSQYIKLLYDLNLLPTDGNRDEEEDRDDVSLSDVTDLQVLATKKKTKISHPLIYNHYNSLQKDEDTRSIGSNSSGDTTCLGSDILSLTAHISQTGILKDPDKGGKSYAVYAITVNRKSVDGEEDVWDVYRRYSDFHDLHMCITEKFDAIPGLILPGKTAFKNMNTEFLEKRRKALDVYLKTLMNADVLQNYLGLFELMVLFLSPKIWEKHKTELARKMDTILNPLRSSVKHMGSAVKHMPDTVADGVGSVFKMKNGSSQLGKIVERGKVGAALDTEAADNIPMRIMLLLMDEVFDLRSKNQWLRRRIVAILRNLIKATFGDTINRKIVDNVEWLTSAEQIAEYVKNFRESFWPCGVLAEPRPPRDNNTKMRTRVVCKAKMFGSMPDEMKTMMGNDTVRRGVMRVFNMFQHKALNKRLVYVLLEGMLETMFPDNKFKDIFRQLHSRSPRVISGAVPKASPDVESVAEQTVRKMKR